MHCVWFEGSVRALCGWGCVWGDVGCGHTITITYRGPIAVVVAVVHTGVGVESSTLVVASIR